MGPFEGKLVPFKKLRFVSKSGWTLLSSLDFVLEEKLVSFLELNCFAGSWIFEE